MRLHGRDQVTELHGNLADIGRLIRTVAWPRSEVCGVR